MTDVEDSSRSNGQSYMYWKRCLDAYFEKRGVDLDEIEKDMDIHALGFMYHSDMTVKEVWYEYEKSL
ncbi:MAG: hypothetical protein CMJ19_07555 [Phycisphaeraceae bacterium]|nr:hypothetical protein [Phycisphaeraceae bacterium]